MGTQGDPQPSAQPAVSPCVHLPVIGPSAAAAVAATAAATAAAAAAASPLVPYTAAITARPAWRGDVHEALYALAAARAPLLRARPPAWKDTRVAWVADVAGMQLSGMEDSQLARIELEERFQLARIEL